MAGEYISTSADMWNLSQHCAETFNQRLHYSVYNESVNSLTKCNLTTALYVYSGGGILYIVMLNIYSKSMLQLITEPLIDLFVSAHDCVWRKITSLLHYVKVLFSVCLNDVCVCAWWVCAAWCNTVIYMKTLSTIVSYTIPERQIVIQTPASPAAQLHSPL